MTSDRQPSTKVVGEPPWVPILGEVMDPAPELLDQLATEFAPIAAGIDPSAYWTAFHCYAVDQLVGAALGDDDDPPPLRSAAWVVYATAYWTGRSWTQAATTDAVVGIAELDLAPSSATADSVSDIVARLRAGSAALEGDADTLLGHVAELIREPAQAGAFYGTAYNSGYLIVIGEAPPVGERPDHLTFEPGYFGADADRPLELSYREALPEWLTRRRDAYEHLATDEPARLANILAGTDDEVDLRTMWRDAFEQGMHNWGGDSIASWTQAYFEPFFRWSVVYNYGLEAITRTALVALALDDDGAAIDAISGNLLYACSWGGFLPGAIDATGQLPEVLTD